MLFTLFDIKSKTYSPIFESRTRDEAIRTFEQVIKSGRDSLVSQYPEDFVLYYLGDFDKTSGKIFVDNTDVVINGFELVKLAEGTKSIDLDSAGSTLTK